MKSEKSGCNIFSSVNLYSFHCQIQIKIIISDPVFTNQLHQFQDYHSANHLKTNEKPFEIS